VQAQSHRADLSSQISKRDRELTQIAKSISELADLFQDLSNLVVEQGTVLDCVEYNVEQTNEHVQGAVKELVVAERYQRRTGRRKCICFLVLVIVGLIIVLIYKPRGHSNSSTEAGAAPVYQSDDKGPPWTEISPDQDGDRPTSIAEPTQAQPTDAPVTIVRPPIRPPSRPGVPIRPPRPRPKPHRPVATTTAPTYLDHKARDV